MGVELLFFFKSDIKMIPFLPFPTLLIPKLKQYTNANPQPKEIHVCKSCNK